MRFFNTRQERTFRTSPQFPDIQFQSDLTGEEGGQTMLIAKVKRLMLAHKEAKHFVNAFIKDVSHAQDYNAVLAIIGQYVDFNDGIFLSSTRWIR